MEYYDLPKNKIFLVTQKAIIFDNNKVLLLKDVFEEKWGLPGGILDIDESLADGLKREVKEETSLNIKIGKVAGNWIFDFKDFKFQDGRVFDIRFFGTAYICEIVGGEFKLSGEHTEHCWVTKQQIENDNFQLAPHCEDIIRKCFSLL